MKSKTLLLLCLCILLGACSMPRVITLTDPLSPAEHNDLGVAYEQMGEFDLALRQYEIAFTRDEQWDQPLINHGNVHAGLEEWKEAEKSYRKALERNPENPEAMNNLAYVLIIQNKEKEALRWSAGAVQLQPDNPAFLNTRAMSLEKTGETEKAREAYLKALNHASADNPLRKRIQARLDSLNN